MKNTLLPARFVLSGNRFLMVVMLLIISMPSKAVDYFWVGGSGNWSDYANHWATTSGGNIFHTAIPTLNDNVIFDANSFPSAGSTVLVDNTLIYCKSMDWTGVQNNPTVNGLGNTINIYGSLTLVPGMNWSVRKINFLSDDPGNTITTAGKSMDTLYFNGLGAYALQDAIIAKSVFILSGSFTTNNHNMEQQVFQAGNGSATPAVDLGTSTITCHDVFRAYDGTVNLTSSGADLLFNNAVNQKIYLWSSGHTFNNITFDARGEVIGSFNCTNLIAANHFYVNSSVATCNVQTADFSASIVLDCIFYADTLRMLSAGVDMKVRQLFITDVLEVNGVCGSPVQISPIDFQPSGTITKTSGSVVVDYVILTSINATGGASFTATNSIDAGNNSGWTINAAAARTLYWVGGSGTWNDENHWALTSGGTAGVCIPSSADDVIFDAASFSQAGDTVKITTPAVCKNMDWTTASFSPVITKDFLTSFRIFGSLALTSSMVYAVEQTEFSGNATGNTILTAGNNIPSILINGDGEWTLADELNCAGIQIFQGTFATANHDIHTGSFAPNGIGSNINVDLGTSTLYISGNYMGWDPSVTINSSNANLEFYSAGGGNISVQFSENTFNDVTILTSSYVSGKLICNDFIAQAGIHIDYLDAVNATFDESFTARSIVADVMTLNAGVHSMGIDSLTINDSFISGNQCNSTLTVKPYVTAPARIIQNQGMFTFNYTYLRNVDASGGATFNALNCWDLGGNTGFSFSSPLARDLYWVGGTGSWHDDMHWALTSGGAPGNCPPGPDDNLHFDSNSFSQSNDTVYVSPTLNAYCRDLIFDAVPNNTVFWSTSGSEIFVNGSLAYTPEVNPTASIEMTSPNAGTTISSGGNFINRLVISGIGTFEQQDEFNLGNFVVRNGTYNTNDFNITTGDINSGGPSTLNLGTSTVSLLGFYSTSGTINGGNADIICTSSFLGLEVLNGFFNSVTFTGTAHTDHNFGCNRLYAMGAFMDINSQITAGYAEFHDVVTLANPFTADSIVLDNPGKIVKIAQVTLNDAMISNGTSGFPIQIEGYNGTTGTITKTTGQVCLDYVLLKDINATGGATFFAGANSVDLGGNTGWLFSSCIPPVTDVWPGDANYDLVADNFDVLNIGLAYNYTGPIRPGATLNWVAQPATDWSAQFANTANLKHADTDGNGIVNDDDTLAVSMNYGLTHLRIQPPVVSGLPAPMLYLEANPDTAFPSDTVLVDVMLGTNLQPADSIYGIAFTVNFDTSLVNTSYLDIDYTGCWMGAPSVDLITFSMNMITQGSLDMTIVRTDQQNTNGFGLLARLGIVIVDNVGAKVSMPLTLSDVKAITAAEFDIPVAFMNDTVVIDTTFTSGLIPANFSDEVSFYPNPSSVNMQVNAARHIIEKYEVFNQLGMLIESGTPGVTSFMLNTGKFSAGLYFINITSAGGYASRKFEVIKN